MNEQISLPFLTEKPSEGCVVRGFSEGQKTYIPFHQILAAYKVQLKISVSELCSIFHAPRRTMEDWIAGRRRPSIAMQDEMIRVLSSGEIPPSSKMQRHMEDVHGLTYEAGKSRWRLRFTIDKGPKFVGERHTIDIGKCSAEEAIKHKETAFKAAQSLGHKVIVRNQKRKTTPKL